MSCGMHIRTVKKLSLRTQQTYYEIFIWFSLNIQSKPSKGTNQSSKVMGIAVFIPSEDTNLMSTPKNVQMGTISTPGVIIFCCREEGNRIERVRLSAGSAGHLLKIVLSGIKWTQQGVQYLLDDLGLSLTKKEIDELRWVTASFGATSECWCTGETRSFRALRRIGEKLR